MAPRLKCFYNDEASRRVWSTKSISQRDFLISRNAFVVMTCGSLSDMPSFTARFYAHCVSVYRQGFALEVSFVCSNVGLGVSLLISRGAYCLDEK